MIWKKREGLFLRAKPGGSGDLSGQPEHRANNSYRQNMRHGSASNG
jgi:hypothetical protein